jgi:hypothetical protein
MKIIRIILFSLLALSMVICAGVFVILKTIDTDQYIPQITKKVSLILGRSVSIGNLGLALSSRGITLDAGPLIISDDQRFTTQPFIKVDKVRLFMDLSSLVLRREVRIREVLLQSPQIHFIRSLEGEINARSIGRSSQVPGNNTVFKRPKKGVMVGPFSEIAVNPRVEQSPITIKSIEIRNASVSFIDQNQTYPLDIWLFDINANLDDFSFSKPFELSFNASPLLLKGISPGSSDSSVLKNITGVVQLNMPHSANGHIVTTGGVIKDFNIIKTVLSHTIGVLGGINGIIDKLGTVDTVIKKAKAEFSFHDKTFFINDSLIDTNIFELTAKGSVDQGLNTDMQTMLRLNEDVSASLINEIDGLKLLCDDSKRIAIDASLKGIIPHLKYKPNKDFRKKSKKLLMQEGGNILGILLGGGKIR